MRKRRAHMSCPLIPTIMARSRFGTIVTRSNRPSVLFSNAFFQNNIPSAPIILSEQKRSFFSSNGRRRRDFQNSTNLFSHLSPLQKLSYGVLGVAGVSFIVFVGAGAVVLVIGGVVVFKVYQSIKNIITLNTGSTSSSTATSNRYYNNQAARLSQFLNKKNFSIGRKFLGVSLLPTLLLNAFKSIQNNSINTRNVISDVKSSFDLKDIILDDNAVPFEQSVAIVNDHGNFEMVFNVATASRYHRSVLLKITGSIKNGTPLVTNVVSTDGSGNNVSSLKKKSVIDVKDFYEK